MAHSKRRVQRPGLLAAFCGFAFAVQCAAAFGLFRLGDLRLGLPVSLAVAADALPVALDDAPWVSRGGAATQIWLLTRPDCAKCAEFEANASSRLGPDVGLRVVVVAPREFSEALAPQRKLAAALAQRRDDRTLAAWGAASGRITPELASFSQDPAAVDGYVQWGRASLDQVNAVLEANGVEPQLPILLWKRGGEWRALTGDRALRIEAVRREWLPEG